nr:unnamed protein product [Digitaria exilis]
MAAKWAQKTVVIPAQRRGCHLITPKHTSASLTINENYDSDVQADTETFLNRIVPEGQNAPWKHTMEGPDDMPAHIKSSMFGCALTIPITDGRLNMGTWQGAPPDQMGASYPHMFFILLLLHGANAAPIAPAGPKWQTLSGRPPQVVARGGFSGLFPDASQFAYQFALSTSLPDVVLFCDLQFSSDKTGFCKTGLTLDNSTTVSEIFPKMERTYKVHGEDVHGWFSLDFTADQLIQNVTLIQNIFSRPSTFDGSMGMYTLDDIVELHPPQIWLNVEFIDNPDFSVDGVLTDFPPTASGAVACLAHSKGSPLPPPGKDTRPLIITHSGASGVFAGSTDLAYQQAIKDAADIIDCSVQMTKDGVAFCMHSADLTSSTTAGTAFVSKSSTVHEIQNKSGIFAFDLSWSEVQTLKRLKRNPAAKNAGKFMTLPQFLDMAKASNVSGILVEVEHASYLAKRGLGVVDAVTSALTKSGYDKETKQQVYIQSDDSSVLSAFKKFTTFKRVLSIEIQFSGASKPSLDDIKKYADGVRMHRSSLAQISGYFMTHFTHAVSSLQAANLTVFIGVLKNEFMNLGFDYFADPTVEIATYSSALMADGLVTDYPATAATFFRSPCSDMSLNLSYSILPAQPGALVNLAAPGALAPAAGPAPVLEPKDVVDPPLPPVKAVITADTPAAAPAADNTSSAAGSNAGNNLLGAGIAALLSLSFLH